MIITATDKDRIANEWCSRFANKEDDFTKYLYIPKSSWEANNWPHELWTTAKLRDEFVLNLARVAADPVTEDNQKIDFDIRFVEYKYYRQASKIIYHIPRWKPGPVYVINRSDLMPRIAAELKAIKKSSRKEFNRVVESVVGRVYEAVDFDYYHLNIAGTKLEWRFER